MAIGGACEVAAVALTKLHELYPDVMWISMTMSVVGGLVAVMSALGYSRSRALVKVAQIKSDAITQVGTAEAANAILKAPPVP
jgi:hypothetical protein